MKKLLVYLKDYKKETIFGPLFKLLEASFELLVPLVIASMIDKGIETGDRVYVMKMCGILIALCVVGFITAITAQYFAAKAAAGFARKVKRALFANIQSLSFSDMDRVGTSAMITRMTSDVNQVQQGVNLTIRLLLRSPFVVFGAMIMAFTIDFRQALIIDTAGRQAVDEELMQQIQDIRDAVDPDEILFVVDAMTGQDAVNTAKVFNDRLDYSGVILTKLDGDTRGGAALSIRSVVNKPIKFVGTGEKMEALDPFHPSRMADRILGMGDIVSLVERAQEQYDEEEARRLEKRIQKNQFDFNDFYKQIQQIKKMGNLKDLVGMIPGVGKAVKDLDINDDAFKNIEAIILSMTPKERTHPECLNTSRRTRIAKGSGTNIQEVNKLIKQFDQTRKMMKMVTDKSKMQQMAGMMKGRMPKM